MKLGLFTVISVASAGFDYFKAPKKGSDERGNIYDKKHPAKVLSAASKIFCLKVAKNVAGNQKKGERICARYTNLIGSLDDRFNRRSCIYHNPLIKNGGPNPDPQSVGARWVEKENGKSFWKKLPMDRRRRDEDESEEYDDYYGLVDGCEDFPEGSVAAEWCDPDHDTVVVYEDDDTPCEGAECNMRRKNKKKKKVKKVKLNKTEKSLKRSLLTVSAWASRHMRECSGMRKHQLIVKRLKGIWAGLRPKLNGYKPLLEGQKAPTL